MSRLLKLLIFGIKISAETVVLPRSGTSICPSDVCWYPIGPVGACDLRTNANCILLQCDESDMTIRFSSELYGVDNTTSMGENPFDHPLDHCKPQWNGDLNEWVFTAQLGDCGISIESEISPIDNSRSLVFVKKIWQQSSLVTFKCNYDSEVSISTNQFDLTKKYTKIEGRTVESRGFLSSKFTLSFFGNTSYAGRSQTALPTTLGKQSFAQLSWSPGVLGAKIQFYIKSCYIHYQSDPLRRVYLISNSCIASVVNGKFQSQPKLVSESGRFSYSIFKFNTIDNDIQMMTCKVSLCSRYIDGTSECDQDIIKNDEDCPGRLEGSGGGDSIESQYKYIA